jgi:L-aminopeptidase/D-esterase-like protein
MKDFFKIGHFTDKRNITGCTVILCPAKTRASCYISGSAPGSRETALLAPERKINEIHALLLTGGSAFGLSAASGVMRYLEEKGLGYKTGFGIVPLVPAAVIYDLNIGNPGARPNAEDAYQACQSASSEFISQGTIGAGTGATVGKWAGISGGMKSGLGLHTMSDGNMWLTALSVVNAIGDIVDENGKIIAGALDDKGHFIAEKQRNKRWEQRSGVFSENTVLSAILTNATINKLEAYILSKRAQNGLARAVIPASTSYDGDIIFSLATGEVAANPDVIFEIGTEAIRLSIIAAVREAESLGGYIAAKDLPHA